MDVLLDSLQLGRPFPNPIVDTTSGLFHLYDYQGDSWLLFFSHPEDFTPICTTEMAVAVDLIEEFNKRDCKLIGLSCDSLAIHNEWAKDVLHLTKSKLKRLPFPLIEDEDRQLAHEFGMVDETIMDAHGMPLTCRAVFIIDPSKKLRFSCLYPYTFGRNFSEIIRVLTGLQKHDADHGIHYGKHYKHDSL